MKIFYEAMDYDIVLDFDDEDPSTCTFEVTCDRMDLVTIVQDGVDAHKFNIAIGTLDSETILVKFAYTVTDVFSNANTTYEYIILRVFNNVNSVRYFTKTETDNILVPITEYEDISILEKICNVDGIGSGLDVSLLDGYLPSEESLESTIPVSNDDSKLSTNWLYAPPVINDISWNDNSHFQDTSYVLTIDATDPQNQDLTYEVEYNDATVSVTPRPSPNEHMFNITYGEYSDIVNMVLTVTVSNSQGILSRYKEYITVNTYPPVINSISWNDDDQYENHSYVMTIDAVDPGGLNISHEVTCNDGAVGIVQRAAPNENIFDITYGEYNSDTNVIYTVSVFNSNGIFISEEISMTITNNGPIVNSITWDDDIHFENNVYVLTIDVSDGETTGATYEVTCNDPTVGIVQRTDPNEHMFNITYGEYSDDTNIAYTITIISSLGTTIVSEPMIIRDHDPKINNIAWNDNNHYENNSYIMTIDATDPLELDLTYDVTCDDATVGITQRADPNEHVFDITYGEYGGDVDVIYTVIATNTNTLSDTKYQTRTIHNTAEAPVINNITWDTEDQYENNSYVMTIDATDPNSLNLTYDVVCDDGTVGIVQRADPNEHIFDITYGDYLVDTDITYSIVVTNTDMLVDTVGESMTIQRESISPVIGSVTWDNSTQTERESYVMTIDATDPNALDLTYEVVCDDGTVGIVQRADPNEHIFDITYGEYAVDTDVEYTITVTNEDTLTDVETEIVTIHNIDPIINTITWDDSDHYENNSYVMTIDATDPNALDLTYEVVCDDGTVGIVQRADPNEHIFDITYGEYAVDVGLLYTITVTNTNTLSDIENESITVHDANPVISNIAWEPTGDQYEDDSYEMTITATDPQSQDLTYDVTCDDGTVGIVQQGTTNVFDITYGAYTADDDLTFTITVTNTDTLTDVETEIVTVHDANPTINSITWDPVGDHDENTTYDMTIGATDPRSQDLTYDVVCDPSTGVTINTTAQDNIFEIIYGDFDDNTDVTFTITVTNTDMLTDEVDENITIHYTTEPPVINTISWDDSDHYESESYVLTIGATDPNSQTLTYGVVCDDVTVDIVQRADPNEHIFDITYDPYTADTELTYTVTVTNEDLETDVEDEVITVHDANPVINTISWDDSDHHENESYVLTIGATDPQSQTLTYGVVCDDATVGIVQRADPNEHIFDITYDEYASDTAVEYTITVTNTDTLTDVETESITVHDTVLSRGIVPGGWIGSAVNVIEYITISTTGNATDFGDLSTAKGNVSATSNGATDRGIIAGGYNGTTTYDVIEYITISSAGDVTDFGDLSSIRSNLASVSNGTNDRGVFGGGVNGSLNTDVIEYITISSTGDTTDFGDISIAKRGLSGTSNGTNNRGIMSGGHNGTVRYDAIEYITISTLGDATDFGDLSAVKRDTASTSNGTNERAVIAGGYTTVAYNVIEYVTISSTGDATDFGDLSANKFQLGATSNTTDERGVFTGGYINGTTNTDVIEYITISSTGNATDFGDLTAAKRRLISTSNA